MFLVCIRLLPKTAVTLLLLLLLFRFVSGAYFCLNMVLITLSSFLSVTVINIYIREDQTNKVPPWLRKVT